MSKTATKPVKSYRLRGISVSVFANEANVEGREVTFHKVSVQRTYREGDDYKSTSSLGRDDLPIAIMLMEKAWEFILEAESGRGKESDPSAA